MARNMSMAIVDRLRQIEDDLEHVAKAIDQGKDRMLPHLFVTFKLVHDSDVDDCDRALTAIGDLLAKIKSYSPE